VQQAIESLPGVQSVLEIGCGPGANLRAWRAAHPEWVLLGVDVNPAAVRWCQRQFAGDRDVVLACEDYLTSPWLPMADVVVSCYSLAYVDPAALDGMLAKCWRSARRGLVLAEPMAGDGLPVGPCAAEQEEWRHDYAEALWRVGARQLITWPVTPPADRLNALVVARKEL
jgi:SAM-dependent methyltransferase